MQRLPRPRSLNGGGGRVNGGKEAAAAAAAVVWGPVNAGSGEDLKNSACSLRDSGQERSLA